MMLNNLWEHSNFNLHNNPAREALFLPSFHSSRKPKPIKVGGFIKKIQNLKIITA